MIKKTASHLILSWSLIVSCFLSACGTSPAGVTPKTDASASSATTMSFNSQAGFSLINKADGVKAAQGTTTENGKTFPVVTVSGTGLEGKNIQLLDASGKQMVFRPAGKSEVVNVEGLTGVQIEKVDNNTIKIQAIGTVSASPIPAATATAVPASTPTPASTATPVPSNSPTPQSTATPVVPIQQVTISTGAGGVGYSLNNGQDFRLTGIQGLTLQWKDADSNVIVETKVIGNQNEEPLNSRGKKFFLITRDGNTVTISGSNNAFPSQTASPTPSPTATPTANPTATPTPTPTPTASPSGSASPTPTPTPTPTASASSCGTPIASGASQATGSVSSVTFTIDSNAPKYTGGSTLRMSGVQGKTLTLYFTDKRGCALMRVNQGTGVPTVADATIDLPPEVKKVILSNPIENGVANTNKVDIDGFTS